MWLYRMRNGPFLASRFGLILSNADICISNTDNANNKYRYLYVYVIRDISNRNADICIWNSDISD